MKTLSYILIFIVVVTIVSNLVYTFLSTFTSSDVVFWGAIIFASILAVTGIREDMKKEFEKNL